jgi:hypothetical protein
MPYVGNKEAIAVNQVWAGDPGRLLAGVGTNLGYEVWYKHLGKGSTAFLVINTGEAAPVKDIVVSLSDGTAITCPGGCAVRDVWALKDQPTIPKNGVELPIGTVAPHDSVFLVVTTVQ